MNVIRNSPLRWVLSLKTLRSLLEFGLQLFI
ncbi:hypothetical protein GFO_3107 [Christiangramia forsetii KT0803]|uniref:Uncharacterized protein n=1 Tax=Christiangramia forsetii (strain DSM 17595 / CGMCC 1.15422 / KT0803) TaxID=411154 RepID=A0M606_CHRFK|nr:hypothetical protein GFO_3107 [Christiangramia forsetii KT0803]